MDTEILLDHEPVADGGYLVRALLRVTGEAPKAEERPTLNPYMARKEEKSRQEPEAGGVRTGG